MSSVQRKEIALRPQPTGIQAIYIIEPETSAHAKQADELFQDLESVLQVRKLSRGKLQSYAVQVAPTMNTLLEEVADVLQSVCLQTIYLHPVDSVALELLFELCRITRSKTLTVPRCGVCGGWELFPPVMVVIYGQSSKPVLRHYCRRCTIAACKPKTSDFVRSLLAADCRGLRQLSRAKLMRRKSNGEIAFTVAS
ncbi:MAG: hypothetical protein ACUVRS_02220 [Armatimonadota bacterium]